VLLGTIVEVTFDAPAFDVESVDQTNPGPGQFGDLQSQLLPAGTKQRFRQSSLTPCNTDHHGKSQW
jgi:hypothetical protein